MPLDASGIVSGLVITAAKVKQFYDMFTGGITDQAATLKNTLRLGGNQGTTASLLRLDGVTSQTGPLLDARAVSTDAQPVLSVSVAGKVSVGAGGASAVDTTLERLSVGNWLISGGIGLTEIATPSAPGAGKLFLYPKSDGILYSREGASGAETAVGSSGFDIVLGQSFGR